MVYYVNLWFMQLSSRDRQGIFRIICDFEMISKFGKYQKQFRIIFTLLHPDEAKANDIYCYHLKRKLQLYIHKLYCLVFYDQIVTWITNESQFNHFSLFKQTRLKTTKSCLIHFPFLSSLTLTSVTMPVKRHWKQDFSNKITS